MEQGCPLMEYVSRRVSVVQSGKRGMYSVQYNVNRQDGSFTNAGKLQSRKAQTEPHLSRSAGCVGTQRMRSSQKPYELGLPGCAELEVYSLRETVGNRFTKI